MAATPADLTDPGSFRHWADDVVRFSDQDAVGHINNVAYYSFFDTAANRFLIERGGLDIAAGSIIGLVVESILVITYTKRAAGELRSRIRAELPNKNVKVTGREGPPGHPEEVLGLAGLHLRAEERPDDIAARRQRLQ